ncbi:SDR family oxidoreductase [Exiguobacterium sp. A1_3_1]|uniref:Dehydrogenase n=2 Tax=Exiguobacterium TaxID=33986 RepID=A0A0V8GFP8_9BACL|nr:MULTISPECIES: SDR family oxidoreductase [Exiguobacterium]AHA29027.1 short-chain dehydrogenase [Exiguobacterium sp. MH3]KSU49061.1 NAD(P)-dependent oxidoreductase [Exiguobacterium enclense]KTR28676.1 dehydrogenase [Exiguobacterium indicum]MBF8153620.1 SDR family oxidoreductase [Exiguobacterium sp. TBG-PICH-001]NTY08674.1 SDR family oxidoreductase [Exiguobacterium sp. JMULE1]
MGYNKDNFLEGSLTDFIDFERISEGLPKTEDEQPLPYYERDDYKAAGKLEGKVAIVTGGNSGIGRAVSIAYVREGAKVVIAFYGDQEGAEETKARLEELGGEVLLSKGDIGDADYCETLVQKTIDRFGRLDIIVNNASMQKPEDSLKDITDESMEKTFKTNIFGMMRLARAALPHLSLGSAIINTTSSTAYEGNALLIDYSATKGAIVSFTRSLSMNLAKEGIRVNAVAPGPIWTPLITETFPHESVKTFGKNTPMDRPGQPAEMASAYVFLACNDSSYMTGQVLHLNGGVIVNG